MHVRESPSACPAGASGYGGRLQARLHYDPGGRLAESLGYVSGVLTTTTRFVYDPGSGSGAGGDALVLEYDGTGAIANRYLHGADAKADDPLIWYPGSSTAASSIRNLYADPRGSIVLVMDQAGNAAATNAGINTYDEWGANQGTASVGRFQYTGQAWLPEVGLYYYKARFYSPTLGRFMQTDPVGYADQVDLYEYVGDDPVDGVDPTGLVAEVPDEEPAEEDTQDENGRGIPSTSELMARGFRQTVREIRDFFSRGSQQGGYRNPSSTRPSSIRPGGAFSRSQRAAFYEQNRAKNGGQLRSDKSGKVLIPSEKSVRGVSTPRNAAQIDHDNPRSRGGTNDGPNARVLAAHENVEKSDNPPAPPKPWWKFW